MNSSICKPKSCINTYCCSKNNECAISKDDCYYSYCGNENCLKNEGCLANLICIKWSFLKIIIIISVFFCFFVTLTICYKKYKKKKNFQVLLLPEFNFDSFFVKKIKNVEKSKENIIEEKLKENINISNQLDEGFGYIATEKRHILSETDGNLTEIDFHKEGNEFDKRDMSQIQSDIDESMVSDNVPNDSEHYDRRAENYKKNIHVDLQQLDIYNKKQVFQQKNINEKFNQNSNFNRNEQFQKKLMIDNFNINHEEKKSDSEESKEDDMVFDGSIRNTFSLQKGKTKYLEKLRQNSSKPDELNSEITMEKKNENFRRNVSMFTGDFYKQKY